MKTPLIFDIKRASCENVPGIRTVIFFKGCNLDCFWCHNPEGKNTSAQIAYFKEKCIGCGECQKECTRTEDECVLCAKCVSLCPVGAKKIYGKEYSAKELFDIICKDKIYYNATNGGVTFSGGECMLYPDFILQLAKMCKSDGISVAVDTAGAVPYQSFEKVLPYVDLFLYDVKAIDPILHRSGTGTDNRVILDNLEKLIKAGANVIIRTPVIPDYNEKEIADIQKYCNEKNLKLELLHYHNLGDSKNLALIKGA